MEKAKEYHRNAVECRAAAARAVNERIRTEMLDIAEVWERLAADGELIACLQQKLRESKRITE